MSLTLVFLQTRYHMNQVGGTNRVLLTPLFVGYGP